MEGSVSSLIGSQIRPMRQVEEEDYDYDYDYDEDYDEEEESYMHREEGRIYGETTDRDGLPLDGTDYQAHMKAAGPGVFIAPGGEVRMIEEKDIKVDDDLLPEELRSKRLPKAVNLKYDEVDPELLAAMEEIENEDWDDDKNEEGFISDDFIQQAIDDKGPVNEFDFDQHIRNLLKAREEKEKSNVELTEDRYAEEIRIDPELANRKERDIDHQFKSIIGQYSEEEDEEVQGGHIRMDDALFQDVLDEYLQDEQAEKKRDYEAWNLNKDDGTRVEAPAREKEVIREVQEEEEEDVDRLIDLQYARPAKEEWDCESICSTYSNVLNHPKVIGVPKKPVKKILISKKTGMPIVEEASPKEEEEDVEMEPVCNSGERRNKKETAEEKRLRKQRVKEEKSAKRQQKKALKEAFKEEKKRADRLGSSSRGPVTFAIN
ncbi:hypothetical protein WA577_003868 [Blastocystis sp. JDR]